MGQPNMALFWAIVLYSILVQAEKSQNVTEIPYILTGVSMNCPADWDLVGDKCFRAFNSEKSWPQALIFCERYGALLAKVESAAENEFLGRIISRPTKSSALSKHWIGLITEKSTEDEGSFVWSDGSVVSRFVGFWAKQQPDFGNGNCVQAGVNSEKLAEWQMEMCNLMSPFVCQLNACVSGSFHCGNGKCVSEKAHCNGHNECGDYSDELNCPAPHGQVACLHYEKSENGKIESPNFPSSYGPNLDCRWVIEGPINSRIMVTFDQFETELNQDLVTVLDGGPSENSTLVLDHLSGSPQSSRLSLITSTNMLTVQFRSDALVQARGFKASWRAVPFSCGGSLKAHLFSQTFSSPRPYPAGGECVWKIEAPEDQVISLNIEEFDIKPGKDQLIIYDGPHPSSPILSRLAGNLSNQLVISTQNFLYIYFYSSQADSTNGFTIHYKKGCNNTIKYNHGNLLSPGNGIIPYPASQICRYVIDLGEGMSDRPISIDFNTFDVQNDDVLKMFDGDVNATVLHEGKGFTEGRNPPKKLHSTKGKVAIVFETNAMKQANGWNLTFSANCPPLKAPKTVFLTTQSTSFGTKVTVSCQTGYEFTNGIGHRFDISCDLGGKWSNDYIPNCQPVYCSAVPQIANGYAVAATNVSYGGIAKFKCYDGFHFKSGKDTEEIYCKTEGWTETPKCLAEICPALPTFLNGERTLKFGDATGYGTVYEFSCAPGYRHNGPNTILCQSDGKWSAQQPVCKKRICPNIPQIENGRIVVPPTGALEFGDSARVECNPGFRSTGADSVKCLANQTLSEVPECRDVDECVEAIASCVTKSTKCLNLEGGYTCQCLDGFKPQLTCPSFHVLSPSLVKTSSSAIFNMSSVTFCAEKSDDKRYLEFEFPAPKVLERIRFEKTEDGVPLAISVSYSPDLKSRLRSIEDLLEIPLKNVDMAGSQVVVLKTPVEAQRVRVRLDRFKDSACARIELMGCQKTNCVDIDECEVANGYCDHQCHNTVGGFKCSCRDGYDLFVENGQGGAMLKEGETGLDNLDMIRYNKTCVPRKCPKVEAPAHGKVINLGKEFAHPNVLEFRCDHGYQIRGSPFLQCTSDGVWNGTVPTCTPAVCEGVQNNTSIGMFVTEDKPYVPYGDNVTVVCTQQNRPIKQSPLGGLRQCIYDPRPDGMDYWLSGPEATCPLVECGPPPALAGAFYEGEDANFKVGSSLAFNCRPPYSLLGKSSYDDRIARCNVDGSWDLGDMRCEGPVCVDPGHPEAGQTFLNSVEEGAVAKFTCDRPGYKPYAYDAINCTLGTSCLLSEDVGISNGYIPDGAFSDSDTKTMWGYEPHKARMSSTGWCGSKDAFIFLSVDLQRIYTLNTLRIAGVAGSGYLRGHVTKLQLFYKVQFSQNYDTYPVEFETAPGNHNKMYQFHLEPPIKARYVLLGVTEYEENPCLKFDMHGCLAPLSTAHEIPSHLQVGWNASVPQCIDAEPPQFINCPANPIFAQTDEFGQILPIKYNVPDVHDNSGVVAYVKVEPKDVQPPFHIHAPLDVKYTAYDEAGNFAECTVQLRVPDTQPPAMKCPESYSVYTSGNETSKHVVFNESTVHVVMHDSSNITEFTISPSETEINLFSAVDVEAVATDSHNNRASCKFQVALLPEPCTEASLRTDDHTIKKCSTENNQTSCIIKCKSGYRFVNSSIEEVKYSCSPSLEWSPKSHPPACVRKSEEPARYEFQVSVDYSSSIPARDECMKPYADAVANAFETLDASLTQKCSSSVQVYVRFLGARFMVDPSNNKMVKANFTVQILPTVLQEVFYELCGLTLSTIFDLKIPGATLPIKTLLQLPNGGLNAPTCMPMNAVSTKIHQGFACSKGEILNKEGTDLPECIPCAKGSVFAGSSCVLCPPGSYQDKDGQQECKKCPEGTFTRTSGTTSRSGCLAVCGNGMFSESGLIPCQLCPRHTFAGPPLPGGYKTCDACPEGTYTANLGATGPSHCKQPCKPGFFSESGLEPCSPCPLNFYQTSLGQQRCIECANNTITHEVGRAIEEECKPLECTGVKCQNKGVCAIANHKTICECRPGFTGEFCEEQVPICDTNPCLNGATCENVAGTFRCICPQNFTGSRCQFGPDECIGVNCPNGGVCQDLPGVGTYKCVCRTGFIGHDCSEIADLCQSDNPCKNGADCVPLQLGRYKCKCLPGWEGPTCERNIDDCKDKPCALGAVCHDLVNDFECECPHGFTGKRCHIKEDLCHPNPCANGDCVDRLFDRECICHEGWTGTHCDQNIDECASAPCRNGGTCRDKENGYDCQCPPGFYGVQCQHQVNHCANAPCQNNATCLNQGAKYRCECPLGFEGTHCELEINECEEKDTCSPEGTEMCEDLINGFRCQCRHGFMGERCEIHQDQCLGEPCMNNASCIDLGSKFKCECKNGWKGERCDLEAGKCEDKPCKNEGHCVNLNDGDYFCVCAEGVSGKNCEHAPNRCIGNPCHNGGVCGDFGSKLECTCPKGFVGAGCEYELDACHHGLCQNGARCETVKNGGYKCHCPPGFTGQNCETEIDECSPHPCPINAKCIDQLNGYYCQCPFNMTGSGCDKQISTDYDLRFNDGVDAAKAAMSVPVPFSSGAFSLSLWIKFDEPHANGDVLTLYNSQTLNGPSNLTELLRVSATSCRLALFPDENPLTLHFPTNQRLNDGEWNNLIITWSAHEGAYSLVWNAIRLYADVGYGKNKQLNINAWINLGRPVDASDNDSKFVGSITRVHVWSRTLNFENDIPTIVQSCQDSPTLFSGLALHFANYDRLFGNVEKIVKSTCGRTDNQKMLLEKRNKDITIEKCPKDIFVVSPMKEVNVSWEEPVFSSMNTVDRVEKNFKNGQMFTFGEFQVLYVAYDNESNSAECSFKVHITREFCPDVQNPSHGQQFCEHWGPDLKYRACSIQCDSGFEFSEHPALFYTCAGDGSWRPRSPDAFTFRYPQCSRRKPASRIVHLKINYPTVTICNIASTDTLSERLLQRIHQLHSKWKICADTSKDTCDGVNVKVQCMGEDWQRQKRETGETFGVRIDIPVQKVPVNDGKSGSRMDPMEVIQNEVFNKDLLNLEHLLPNGRPDLNSFRLDEEFRCKLGEVNVKDSCVACASGSFYDQKTQSCIQCPAGQYQPNEGQLSCLTCPGNGVTTSPGAVSSEECKPRCDAGYSLELHNGQCEPCGLGFYQPFEGSFECVPCGVGKTTLKTTSRSEEDCRDECPDGEHLTLSGACQPCPLGAYRTKGLHKQCVECPAGTTTEKVKSVRRADCNTPRCDPGQFLVTATKKCQFCPRGTFQDQPLQSTCKICPTDYTTAASGATHESQCYSTNQCATGENNCSWHAVCIDLPDDNDVPSFECKCKPGFRGNGTVCTDACLNFCLNDGICKKNNLGYVECNCKENFSGERCEIRFQPRTQKIMHATLCIGFLVFLAIVIIVAVWGIRQRFKKDDVGSIHKPVIPSMDPLDPRVNFMYANPRRSASSGGGSVRPIGFYYEDDNQPDSNEVKTMFVEETTTVVERPQPPTEEPPQETQVERFAWPAQNETNSSNNNVQNTNTEPTNVYQSRYTTSYDNDRFAAMRRHFYENRQS